MRSKEVNQKIPMPATTGTPLLMFNTSGRNPVGTKTTVEPVRKVDLGAALLSKVMFMG